MNHLHCAIYAPAPTTLLFIHSQGADLNGCLCIDASAFVFKIEYDFDWGHVIFFPNNKIK